MKIDYIRLNFLFIIGLFVFNLSFGQLTIINNNNENPTIGGCVMPITNYQNRLYIPPREWVKERLENRMNPCSTIEVTYNGFPSNVINPSLPGPEQAAFQFAVDIWETLLDSPVTIRINANWTNLGASTLGSASAAFFAEVPGGGTNTLYAAALAESLVGSELNGTNSIDVNCNFNSQFANWYFGTDGNPASNQFDFVSVVLHELGHGLGVAGFGIRLENFNPPTQFTGHIRREQSGLSVTTTSEYFSIWDTFIEGQDIFANNISILDENNFPDGTDVMLAAFTSNNLTCNSAIAIAQNSGVAPKTFAPSNFSPGSSYSHWDETTFNGTPNALMTPFFGQGEAIHDPGNVTLGFMEDMGWSLCQGSLSTNDFTLEDVKISPNPFTESLTITLPSQLANQEFNVSIVDINGRLISSSVRDKNNQIVVSNLNDLKGALYFLKIQSITSNLSITKKIIKTE